MHDGLSSAENDFGIPAAACKHKWSQAKQSVQVSAVSEHTKKVLNHRYITPLAGRPTVAFVACAACRTISVSAG